MSAPTRGAARRAAQAPRWPRVWSGRRRRSPATSQPLPRAASDARPPGTPRRAPPAQPGRGPSTAPPSRYPRAPGAIAARLAETLAFISTACATADSSLPRVSRRSSGGAVSGGTLRGGSAVVGASTTPRLEVPRARPKRTPRPQAEVLSTPKPEAGLTGRPRQRSVVLPSGCRQSGGRRRRPATLGAARPSGRSSGRC